MNHGLIPGRQVVFFIVVNPMDNQDGIGEKPYAICQFRCYSRR